MGRAVARRAPAWLVGALLVGMALLHSVVAGVGMPAPMLRPLHVGCMLVLVFLLWSPQRGRPRNLSWWDVVCALVAVATTAYLLTEGRAFWNRTLSRPADVFFGAALILLVLEACRRTTGWGLPIVAALALAFALSGPWVFGARSAVALDIPGVIAVLYQSLDGIYGAAVDVSATLVVPFAIFGAFLDHSGARRYFHASVQGIAGRGPHARARAMVLWSLLCGGAGESGASVSARVAAAGAARLADASGDRAAAAGVLTGCAVAAVIAPPVLGAAALMIVAFLGAGLIDVVRMTAIPSLMYAGMLLWMIMLERPSSGTRAKEPVHSGVLGATRFNWFHFVAPVALVVFLICGLSPAHSVLLSIAVALVLSFRNRVSAMYPAKVIAALQDGALRSLDVAAICAAAGIVVGMANATGLAIDIRATAAAWPVGLPLVAVCAGLVVAGMSIMVPVTAAYIIGATLVAPPLVGTGAPEAAAHMFVFYVAVLCGLPSLALAPAVGPPRVQAILRPWTYTLPALVVPAVLIFNPVGLALLLEMPADGAWPQVVQMAAATVLAMATLAAGARNRLLRRCRPVERALLIVSGLLLAYPTALAGLAGLAGLGAVLAWQKFGPNRRHQADAD